MPRKHHSKRRHHRRSQRGGDWFGSSSTPSSGSDSGSGWFSGITNKAKGLTSSISSWFGSSVPSSAATASGYQSPPPQQGQYGPQGQYAGRRRHTRKLGRHGKSKKRRGGGAPLIPV